MKVFVLFFITFILLILDTSFIVFFDFNNYYPSVLSLCFFIYCLNNEKYGITCLALFIGFLQDVFFYNGFGINIFLNLVIGLSLYFLSVKYNRSNYMLSVFLISCVSLVKSFLVIIYMNIVFKVNILIVTLLYEFIYTFILLLFMYPIFNSIFKSKLFKKMLEF